MKVPAVSGVTVTSMVWPAGISSSSLSGRRKKPCVTSSLWIRSLTVSPFLSVIRLGMKAKRFAVISTTGRSPACAVLVPERAASAERHNTVTKIPATLLRNIIPLSFVELRSDEQLPQELLHAIDSAEFAGREFDVFDRKRTRPGLRFAVKAHAADAEILEGMILVEGQRVARPRNSRRVGKRKDQRACCVMLNVATVMFIVAMNVSVEHGHVVIRGEDIHHIVAIAGKPLPVRAEIEQRTMGEHHDGRGLGKTSQVFLQPRELFDPDFRLGSRDVVECDKMHSAVVERVMAFAEEFAV